MAVRGAPLIGATAAYGLALRPRTPPTMPPPSRPRAEGRAAHGRQPGLGLDRMALVMLRSMPPGRARRDAAWAPARLCRRGRDHQRRHRRARPGAAAPSLQARQSGRPLNVLTHCNAGWLATVDWGTALAPIYKAHDAGNMPVHVWVDETRPRNQGASLTAWELGEDGVPHTVIADNAGGHLMQHGLVDLVIVGTDRVTARGDVCNKIGTYLKALAAHDNGVPFYVALPHVDAGLACRTACARSPSRNAARAR
jgi:methylthioribose-1-phosphate isomerase